MRALVRMSVALCAALALSSPAEATPPNAESGSSSDQSEREEGPSEIPGGYRGVMDTRPPEPRDGREDLTIAGILIPLGALRGGAGAAAWWIGGPGCADVAPQVGVEESGCSGLRNYGIAGVALGGLMFTTGIVYLAIGLTRRERHQRWQSGIYSRRENFQVGPGFMSIRF